MATLDLSRMAGGSPKPGAFWLNAELNFREHNATANDIFRIMKLRDGWIIRDSYWRIVQVGTSGTDWHIGKHDDTDSIIAITDPTSATDWAQGSYTPAATWTPNDDEFVEIKVVAAAETQGILRVMIEIVAGQDQNEPSAMVVT
jgi:hypothetical protein